MYTFFLLLFLFYNYYNYSPAADWLPWCDSPLLWICVSVFSPVNIAWKYGHPAAKTTRWAAISTSSAMMVTSHNTLWLQRGEDFIHAHRSILTQKTIWTKCLNDTALDITNTIHSSICKYRKITALTSLFLSDFSMIFNQLVSRWLILVDFS